MLIIVLSVLAAWCALALVLALLIGRAIRIADRRAGLVGRPAGRSARPRALALTH